MLFRGRGKIDIIPPLLHHDFTLGFTLNKEKNSEKNLIHIIESMEVNAIIFLKQWQKRPIFLVHPKGGHVRYQGGDRPPPAKKK